jgi:hypothetical protein
MHEKRNEQRSYDDVLADAVRVLTEAARRVITRIDRDGRARHEQVDFAELVTHALADATGRIGGIEPILAGRPGSWKADHLRDLLCATAGCDEHFQLERRTEPAVVRVYVSAILDDLGIWTLYEPAYDELDRREDVICAASPYPKPISREQDAELAAIDELQAALHAQRLQESAAYGAAFHANVLRAAGELFPTLPVPVEVIVELDRQHDHGVDDDWDGPVWRLREAARSSTPLPGSEIPLQDYPPGADLAHLERDAGRDPLTRLRRGEARR